MTKLFVADAKFPDVITQLQARGWRHFPHESFPKFDLKWTNYAKIAWPRVHPQQILNHFHGAIVLSRKNELAARLYGSAVDSHHVDAFYPRTLDLGKHGDVEKLVAWFLYARAVGVVRSVVEQIPVSKRARGDEIRAAVAYLDRILRLDTFFSSWSSSSMDLTELETQSELWRPLWQKDQKREEDTIKGLDQDTLASIDRNELEQLLLQLRARDVQMDCIAAGYGDVWICKPSNLSQGRGIHLLTDLDALLQLSTPLSPKNDKATMEHRSDGEQRDISSNVAERATRWVVQKYVERPLLLQHGGTHKFDVRQWVLISALEPLTVYWYKDCYLRFCAHAFTLASDALGDSFTHLSNYSIQKDVIPDDNGTTSCEDKFESMWHSRRFQEALWTQHGRDVWSETIVPQMQHATLTAIKAALPELRSIGRGFEWLGIDFLIDADFRVWLLEVNVSPDVSHSTEVTAALVPDATRGVFDCEWFM